MVRIVETPVYTFDELSDDAKERARDWYREGIESEELTDYDDWETIAEILGVEFKRHDVQLMGGGTRSDPCIYWSGFSSQGDGASFEGRYSYAVTAPDKIRDHAPEDATLHHIADALETVQEQHGYRLAARITQSGNYSHSGTMRVDVYDSDDESRDIGDAEAAITRELRRFADWIYQQLDAQNDYLTSDEQVDESILANGYEFTADGSRSND